MIGEKENQNDDRFLPRLRDECGVGGVIPKAIGRVEGNSNPEPSVLNIARLISVSSIARGNMMMGDFISLYLKSFPCGLEFKGFLKGYHLA